MFELFADSRRRAIAVLGIGLPLAALILLVVAWAIDSSGADRVRRNVQLGNVNIGRDARDDVAATVSELADGLSEDSIAIVTPTARIPFTAAELGVSVDQPATVDAALALDDGSSSIVRPFTWLASLFSSRQAPVIIDVDRDALIQALDSHESAVSKQPVEPAVEYRNGEITMRAGSEGRKVDAMAAADQLERLENHRGGPIELTVREWLPIEPSITDEAAADFAAAVNRGTADELDLTVGDETRQMDGRELRRLLTIERQGDGYRAELDDDAVMTKIERLFDDVRAEPTESLMVVEDKKVIVDKGSSGSQCCDPTAVNQLELAIANETTEIDLDTRPYGDEPDEDIWTSLGIVERVSTFRTNYTPGQSRNINIQRIADLTRGVIIEPGETFSVNDFIGRRTKANGFVEAGVIYRGVFSDDVGGGISQYATTLFNAAFFAGLDFGEYQSHSIYLSRYPYGREATLSFPNPDLEIENTTPYGVMIWPSYTDSSIRIDLYSTRWVEAGQTGQRTRLDGECTVVITERTRTYIESGEVDSDNVIARYRPEEGLNCDGSDSNPDDDDSAPGDATDAAPVDEDTPGPTTTTTPPTTTAPTTTAPTTTTAAPSDG